jgi:hypothetical protein
MLAYSNPEKFFNNCLEKSGLDGQVLPTIAQIKADAELQKVVVRTLNDLRNGADAIFVRGKPSGEVADFAEWESHWTNWTASRSAAFYSRAALLMLGQKEYFGYFINTLKDSDNLEFLSCASDVLQHASGHYLFGENEELTRFQLSDYWQQRGF